MALRPDSENSTDEQQPARPSTEQEMLMREVDDAVRQDQLSTVAKNYGWPLGILLVLGLGSFGGWLYWTDREESRLEQGSEQLITALDAIEAGADGAAVEQLAALSDEGAPGTAAAAMMLRASQSLKDGRIDEAVHFFDQIAADPDAPQPYRDLATIRAVATNFDKMDPQEVVDRLKPLAVPGNPWFGSAGELVGMAYLAQDKPDLAGPLFAEVATNDDVPESLQARTRQIAGLLGYDAVKEEDIALVDADSAENDGQGPAQE